MDSSEPRIVDAAQIDLLDWIVTTGLDVRTARAAARAGLTDRALLDTHRDLLDGQAGAELRSLIGLEPAPAPLTLKDLEQLPLIGHAVYAHDRDNVEDWVLVAQLVLTYRTIESWSRGQQWYWRTKEPREFIAEILAIGRGPRFAHDLLQRAADSGVAPDLFGITTELTPAIFSTLALAGVTGKDEVNAFRSIGLDVAEMAELAQSGVRAGAAVAAAQLGLPREDWAATLSGLRAQWFPLGRHRSDPVSDGPLGALGFTLEQLKTLADNGWSEVPQWNLLTIEAGHGRRSRTTLRWSSEQAVQFALDGLTPKVLARWCEAMVAGSKQQLRGEPVQFSRSLFAGQYPDHRIIRADDVARWAVTFRELKVSPSSLNDYRYGGCVRLDDVVSAANAGIGPSRVKQLRDRFGLRIRYDSRKYFPSLQELIAAHQRALTDDAREAVGEAAGDSGAPTT